MKGEAELVNHAQGQVQCYLNLSSVVGKRRVFALRDEWWLEIEFQEHPKMLSFQ